MFKIIIIFLACGVLSVFSEESKGVNSPGATGMTFVNIPVTNGVGDLGTAGRAISQIKSESQAKSYTGLSLQEEEKILSHIDPTKMQKGDKDSLWTTISNAYIRNYPKLFKTRN